MTRQIIFYWQSVRCRDGITSGNRKRSRASSRARSPKLDNLPSKTSSGRRVSAAWLGDFIVTARVFNCHTAITQEKAPKLKQSILNTAVFFSVSPTWSTRPTTGCRARSTFLWVYRNLFCQKTETCMVRACHTPQQPLQNHLQDTSKDGQRLGRQRKC